MSSPGSADDLWQLPEYRMESLIGRGGFSSVYRAHQLSLDRAVAVKVLNTDLATEADRSRFERERRILSRSGSIPTSWTSSTPGSARNAARSS